MGEVLEAFDFRDRIAMSALRHAASLDRFKKRIFHTRAIRVNETERKWWMRYTTLSKRCKIFREKI